MSRKVSTLIKANGGSYCSGERDRRLDADVNITFYPSFPVGDGDRVAFQHMACGNIAVVEGLNITLDGSAVHAHR